MEIGLLVVQQSKNHIKCHIAPFNKLEPLAYHCMRPIEDLMIRIYGSWGRQADKLRSYIGSSMDFKSEDLIIVRDINSKFRELAKNYDIYWPDHDYHQYKTLCLKWLTDAKREVSRLIKVLERHSSSPSGPLSRRDPYYPLLPELVSLRRTLGSLELGYRLVERRLPIILAIVQLGYSEEKPYRQTSSKIRHALGTDDKMSGTRIETQDVDTLVTSLKNLPGSTKTKYGEHSV